MSAYLVVVIFHSWFRWIVLLAGVLATIAAWRQPLSDARGTDRWGRLFVISADIQMFVGLALYVGISPMMKAAVSDWGNTLHNPFVRFFALDHPVLMAVAIVLIHIGRARARSAATPEIRRSRLRTFFTVGLIVMLIATPWPFSNPSRPWFRTWSMERD